MYYEEPDLKKIFLDRDGDGITDTVDLQLHLNPSCSQPYTLSAVMDLSATLADEILSAQVMHGSNLSLFFSTIMGVHPTTVWVRMKVDGEEVVNQKVKTDIERIWEIYQSLYPHITFIDFITEVADETTRGGLLKICASAHLQTNLAILKLLNYLDFRVNKIYLCEGDEAHFMLYRERPLVLK